MTDLAVRLAGVGELGAVGLRLPKKLTYEQWVAVGQQLTRFHEASSWAIADWLFYGEWEYGQNYEQALELTGLGYQALADLKYVAGRFDASRRREKLSLAHHREVAALPSAEADELLARAEQEEWSRNRLRETVAERNGRGRTEPGATDQGSLPPAAAAVVEGGPAPAGPQAELALAAVRRVAAEFMLLEPATDGRSWRFVIDGTAWVDEAEKEALERWL